MWSQLNVSTGIVECVLLSDLVLAEQMGLSAFIQLPDVQREKSHEDLTIFWNDFIFLLIFIPRV